MGDFARLFPLHLKFGSFYLNIYEKSREKRVQLHTKSAKIEEQRLYMEGTKYENNICFNAFTEHSLLLSGLQRQC